MFILITTLVIGNFNLNFMFLLLDPPEEYERKRDMHSVGERQRWTIGKRQKCATELFLFLCLRFYHRLCRILTIGVTWLVRDK
jgi:hypothetical protein